MISSDNGSLPSMWKPIITPTPQHTHTPEFFQVRLFLLQNSISKGAWYIEYCTKKHIWKVVFDMYVAEM